MPLKNFLIASSLIIAILIAATSRQPALSHAQTIGLPPVAIVPGFDVAILADGFDYPTAFAFLPGGRMLVAEQSGLVKLIQDGVVRQQPVLDLRDKVNARAERGLLGIAADPKFAANDYFYLLYTYDAPGQNLDDWDLRAGVLARYTLVGETANMASEKILFDDYKSDVAYHSLGTLRFAANGDLFVSLGDGAMPGDSDDKTLRAQDLNGLQGKLLRLNPADGAGLPGNPFYEAANPHSARSRIWAYGLRNPFRFALHPQTGWPVAGNVGWYTFEAIDTLAPGTNFGWPCVESIIDRPEYQPNPACKGINARTVTLPTYTYQRQSGKNAAVVGGDFNTGNNFPPEMKGSYFYGDYAQEFIKRLVFDTNGKLLTVAEFATHVHSPVDIQFGPEGALYVLSRDKGELRRISYRASNALSQPRIAASVVQIGSTARFVPPVGAPFITAFAPVTVTFSGQGSFDLDRDPLSYRWLLGEGSATATTLTTTHTYRQPGRYLARLVITDSKGFREVATKVIVVQPRPQPGAIASPAHGDVLPPNTRVQLTGHPTLTQTVGAWSVVAYEGPISRTVLTAPGTQAAFAMPALGDDGRIEVRYETRNRAGEIISTSQITLYALAEDGYIRNAWLVPGAYERMLDYDALPGGERHFALPDPSVNAQRLRSASRKINLAQSLQPNDHTAGYAFVWIDSPSDREGLLGLLSDDGIVVWLNGNLVWHHKTSRFVPDDTHDIDLPPIKLKKGLNALLIKVDQNTGEWSLKARVLNSDGSIMRDIALRMALSEAQFQPDDFRYRQR